VPGAQYTYGLSTRPVFHGRVQPELATITSPAAEAGFTIQIAPEYWEAPWTLAFKLVTEAGGGNRQIGCQLQDPGGVTVAAVPVASTQAGGLTYTYSFCSWLTSAAAVEALTVMSPFFPLAIPPKYSIVVTVGTASADDQISNIRYYRDRFQTGDLGYPQAGTQISPEEVVAIARRVLEA